MDKENGGVLDIFATELRGHNGFHLACNFNHTETIKYLLNHVYNNNNKLNEVINSTGNDGLTPILFAAMKGNLSIIKILVAYNCDLNKAQHSTNNTALSVAAQENQAKCVEFLIQQPKCDVNIQNVCLFLCTILTCMFFLDYLCYTFTM